MTELEKELTNKLAAARAFAGDLAAKLYEIKCKNPELCIGCGEMMTDLIGHVCPEGDKDGL